VKWTTDLRLVSRLRISGAVPPALPCDFVACMGTSILLGVYGDKYTSWRVWGQVCFVACMGTSMLRGVYGGKYASWRVWRQVCSMACMGTSILRGSVTDEHLNTAFTCASVMVNPL
jgi:hypothetical protein